MCHYLHPSFENLACFIEEAFEFWNCCCFLLFFLGHKMVSSQSLLHHFLWFIPNRNHFLILSNLNWILRNLFLLIIRNETLILRINNGVHILLDEIFSDCPHIITILINTFNTNLFIWIRNFRIDNRFEEIMIPIQFQCWKVFKHRHMLKMLSIFFTEVQMNVLLHFELSFRLDYFRSVFFYKYCKVASKFWHFWDDLTVSRISYTWTCLN